MMNVEIRPLRQQDFALARQFAITGMHLARYTRNRVELAMYSRYFWNTEITQATRVYGAYLDGQFVGALLAKMAGESPVFPSKRRVLANRITDWCVYGLYGAMAAPYDQANDEMLQKYRQTNEPDGEILFFAVDPQVNGQGIGTKLVDQLRRDEQWKLIYLYSDSSCSYQFYDHRGFERVGEKQIELSESGKVIPLTCYLYSKLLGEENAE